MIFFVGINSNFGCLLLFSSRSPLMFFVFWLARTSSSVDVSISAILSQKALCLYLLTDRKVTFNFPDLQVYILLVLQLPKHRRSEKPKDVVLRKLKLGSRNGSTLTIKLTRATHVSELNHMGQTAMAWRLWLWENLKNSISFRGSRIFLTRLFR